MTYTISIGTQNSFNLFYNPHTNKFDGKGDVMADHILESEYLESYIDSAISRLMADGYAWDRKGAENMLMIEKN